LIQAAETTARSPNSVRRRITFPPLKAVSRGNWSAGASLSYNSQMWREDSAGTWLTGYDVGYGLGWTLQLGSLLPVWGPSQIDHYLFIDSSGAEYSLPVNNNGVWSSLEGRLVTSYTYNGTNQLLTVSMPRNLSTGGQYTQTRSFQWTGSDLTSATNPENGTVTYQYDGAYHVTQRADAMGQQTKYSYDSYARLTLVQHYGWAGQYGPNGYYQSLTGR
jgi:YD repeat-containing protein